MHRTAWRLAGAAFLIAGLVTACQNQTPPPNQQNQQRGPGYAAPTAPPPTAVAYQTPPRR
jgi:hypothetical protein